MVVMTTDIPIKANNEHLTKENAIANILMAKVKRKMEKVEK